MRVRTGMLAAITAALVVAIPGIASAAYPGADGRIVVSSTRDHIGERESGNYYPGTPELYVMRPDGSHARRFTHNRTAERDPAWSPDASRIAFGTPRDGLFVKAIGARRPAHIVDGGVSSPTWSADGSKLAYERGGHIYVVGAHGHGNHRIADGGDPAWSPTSNTIAFSRGGKLWLTSADGAHQRPIANQPYSQPDWAPGGRRIVGRGDAAPREAETAELWIVNADGTGSHRLTSVGVINGQPSWSPSGTRIAFTQTSTEGPLADWIVNADGSHLQRFGDHSNDQSPNWGIKRGSSPGNDAPYCSRIFPTSRRIAADGKAHDIFLHVHGAPDPDRGDDPEVTITAVTQDERVGAEPDAWGGYYGHEVWLRGQRNRRGDGRVYRLRFRMDDHHGGTCTGVTRVTVRRFAHRRARDSGHRYNSYGPGPRTPGPPLPR